MTFVTGARPQSRPDTWILNKLQCLQDFSQPSKVIVLHKICNCLFNQLFYFASIQMAESYVPNENAI